MEVLQFISSNSQLDTCIKLCSYQDLFNFANVGHQWRKNLLNIKFIFKLLKVYNVIRKTIRYGSHFYRKQNIEANKH